MPASRVCSGASVAATCLFTAIFLSPAEAAKRCAANEVYRPTLGACQQKDEAASEGIFNFWPFSRKADKAESKLDDKAKASAKSKMREASIKPVTRDPVEQPKLKQDALAVIEKQAPLVRAVATPAVKPPSVERPQEALAFSAHVETRLVQSEPVVVKPREISPYGSLIAFEPQRR